MHTSTQRFRFCTHQHASIHLSCTRTRTIAGFVHSGKSLICEPNTHRFRNVKSNTHQTRTDSGTREVTRTDSGTCKATRTDANFVDTSTHCFIIYVQEHAPLQILCTRNTHRFRYARMKKQRFKYVGAEQVYRTFSKKNVPSKHTPIQARALQEEYRAREGR